MLSIVRRYLDLARHGRGALAEDELADRVYQQARCAVSRVDPDQWFPVAVDVTAARGQAADAIAVCATCPVRADCLEFALRHGSDIGAHGVWGGLVERERLSLRNRWLAGTTVTDLLREEPKELTAVRALGRLLPPSPPNGPVSRLSLGAVRGRRARLCPGKAVRLGCAATGRRRDVEAETQGIRGGGQLSRAPRIRERTAGEVLQAP